MPKEPGVRGQEPEMEIANKTFLITGSASGLGAGTAKRLTAAGANVVLADLNQKAGAALAADLGQKASFVQTDVTSEQSGQAAIEAATSRFGALHGLVS